MARNRTSRTPESARSPRASRGRRTDLSGMDLDPEDSGDDYSDNGEPVSRKRKIVEDDEDADEDDVDGDEHDDEIDGDEHDEEPDADDAEEGEQEEGEGDDAEAEAEPVKEVKVKKIPKKRGRKKTKLLFTDEGYLDEDGNPISIENDEVVIEDEDPKGKEKVDIDGNLQGGRRYRMKTFTLLGNGNRLYMVSTEPARLVGFRDSYLLFKTHRSLFKKVCTHEEKMDLIDRHLIPNSYKGRAVNLVTARSIFREFGAIMIDGGKKVTDDFWEQKAIDRGEVAGEYADPYELSKNISKLGNILGDGANGGSPAATGAALVNYQSDSTWMYQIALQTKEYNSTLLEQRNQVWQRGAKDIYNGFNFFPVSSQPTKCKIRKVGPALKKDTITYDTSFYNKNLRRKPTGLASVPKEIFDDIEDEEVKRAILEQQEYEKSLI